MNPSVLIPYKPDGGQRDRLFNWVVARWREVFPFQVCIGRWDEEPFNRSGAVNRAAALAKGDALIIADADLVCDPEVVWSGLRVLGEHPHVIPWMRVRHLAKGATETVMASRPRAYGFERLPIDTTLGAWHGGLGMVTREAWERVGGMDERFRGWGGEDDSLAFALEAFYGPHKRLNRDIYHLWHPRSQMQMAGSPYYQRNLELYHQYAAARGNTEAMTRLLEERDAELSTLIQAV